MAENRKPREIESREISERPKQWMQPELLPEPDKQPGYSYRWIRVASLGTADPRNLSAKLREGWEPVKAVDHPELQLFGNAATGNVEIGGLMLCKMSKEMADARDEYYSKQAQNQMDSVDNHFMRNNDPRMPLFSERSSSTSRGGFGSGSK